MDLATLIGIVGGLVLVFMGIVTGDRGMAALPDFLHFTSIIITVGGSLASTLTSFSVTDFVNGLKSFTLALKAQNSDIQGSIKKIIDLSNVARKEGLLALEEAAQEIDDAFMKKGILLIVDGTDPELIKGIMETELDCLEERHGKVIKFWDVWGALAPAWGMIGTLIGLVNMLKTLEDAATIGPNMSVALLTTLYGSLIANWVSIPMSNKLKGNSEQEIMLKSIMIEGLLSIQAGENPRVIEEKLKSFLAPKVRESLNEVNEGGE